jgi:hypothetical protein
MSATKKIRREETVDGYAAPTTIDPPYRAADVDQGFDRGDVCTVRQ